MVRLSVTADKFISSTMRQVSLTDIAQCCNLQQFRERELPEALPRIIINDKKTSSTKLRRSAKRMRRGLAHELSTREYSIFAFCGTTCAHAIS
jgi:hypothetical protein